MIQCVVKNRIGNRNVHFKLPFFVQICSIDWIQSEEFQENSITSLSSICVVLVFNAAGWLKSRLSLSKKTRLGYQ